MQVLYLKLAALFLAAAALCANPAGAGDGGLYLVGLGPGDPDLATVKAMNLIRQSDVIYTFGGDILERFSEYLRGKDVREFSFKVISRHTLRDAKRESGDLPGGAAEEAEIDRQHKAFIGEVKQAVEQGKTVLFIDNGDPLIYGPWVWFIQAFKGVNVEMEVVPGISSFNAGLAAVGRDGTWAPETFSVILTTDRPYGRDRMEALAAHRSSMAIFTHKTDFTEIIRKLKLHYAPETPVAVVFYAGFKGKQTVVRGSLDDISSRVDVGNLPLEHIIFVGDFLAYDLTGIEQEGQ